MDHTFCPGAKVLRQPQPETFQCPHCGEEVEIWSDEIKGTCQKCHNTVMRDGMMSCLDWCKYGKDCVGEVMYNRYQEGRAAGLKRQILAELETTFQKDTATLETATDTLHFAEQLLETEKADWHIVMPASLLTVVATPRIPARESGPRPIAPGMTKDPVEKLLFKSGMKLEDIQAICRVLGYLGSSRTGDEEKRKADINYLVLHDAVLLAAWHKTDGAGFPALGPEEPFFLTESGRKIADGIGIKARA